MAIARAITEEAGVAVFAKAPLPGYAKTRLIPVLGAAGAAALQERLIARTVATACRAGVGPVILWGAPDADHPTFVKASREQGIGLAPQRSGDLGERMLAAFMALPNGAALVLVGTDCPVLTPDDLRAGVAALRGGADVVIAPTEDGGYGLIGARRPIPDLFRAMPWSTEHVARITRERARSLGLKLCELRTIWDVDAPADLERLGTTPIPGFDATLER